MNKRTPVHVGTAKSHISDNLSPETVNNTIAKRCKSRPIVLGSNKNNIVFFTPHAWDEFVAVTHYGKWVAENRLERIYFLEGYYFIDENKRTSTVVTNVIAPPVATQKETFAQLYSKDFDAYAFVNHNEAVLKEYGGNGLDNRDHSVINPFFDKYKAPMRVGFGHTHPDIGVFFSSTDKKSVFAVPGEPWITMVADPRREELLITVGRELTKATTVFFEKNELYAPAATSQTDDNGVATQETTLEQLMKKMANENCKFKIEFNRRNSKIIEFSGIITQEK